jgi:hypothetical protein
LASNFQETRHRMIFLTKVIGHLEDWFWLGHWFWTTRAELSREDRIVARVTFVFPTKLRVRIPNKIGSCYSQQNWELCIPNKIGIASRSPLCYSVVPDFFIVLGCHRVSIKLPISI